ncbi:hypothetical protein M2428_001291 [Arthrobacter sp. ES3-54]|nr:hypothetical protein [Arthrobacter sp. ES3-54]
MPLCPLVGTGTGHVPSSPRTGTSIRTREWACPACFKDRHSIRVRERTCPSIPMGRHSIRTREWTCSAFTPDMPTFIPDMPTHPHPGVDMPLDPHGHAHPSGQRMDIMPLCSLVGAGGGHVRWCGAGPGDLRPRRTSGPNLGWLRPSP